MQTVILVSAVFVIAGVLSALWIFFDLRHRPQAMPIMRSVWVLTGLWAGLLGVCLYLKLGRTEPNASGKPAHRMGMPTGEPMGMHSGEPVDRMEMPSAAHRAPKRTADRSTAATGAMQMAPGHSDWHAVVRSTLHCGAGCTLADLIGEWFLCFVPIAVGGSLLAGSWIVDYLLALTIGVYFQYAAIRSMRSISRPKAFGLALKADFLSLTAWQAGMYGWMALTIHLWPGLTTDRTTWIFWCSMQIGMLCGFLCSYPVNVLLIRHGIKSAMD